MPDRAFKADTLRSIAFGSITASYANLGAALAFSWQTLLIQNTTDACIFISENGTDDQYELGPGTSQSLDLQANVKAGDVGVKPVGTQFQVKGVAGSLPSAGKVILQGQYL